MTPLTELGILAAALFLFALLFDLARARARLRQWPVLTPADEQPVLDVRVLLAPGVTLDDATYRAAVAFLLRESLDAAILESLQSWP